MDRAMRNFIIILAIDIAVFGVSLYIWCKKRSKIIAFIHTGFTGIRMKYYRKQKEEKERTSYFDNIDHVEVKRPYLFKRGGSSRRLEATDKKTSNDGSADTDSIYMGNDDTTESKAHSRTSSPQARRRNTPSWWYHLLYGNERNIRNNEAVLYLRFMRSTCMMLMLCSVVAVLSNGIIFAHLAINNKPFINTTYRLEDLLRCKLTIWILYANTWIYSIIVYVYILNFRSLVNDGKQITVILRPQLHTIMVTGFEKTVTDPTHIYKYFEKYFPGHILSVHIVFNHSRRLLLEEELEATKAQLTLCRDTSIILPTKSVGKDSVSRGDASQKTDKEAPIGEHRKQVRGVIEPRRSLSCGVVNVKERKNLLEAVCRIPRRSQSSKNLKVLPKSEKKEIKRETYVGKSQKRKFPSLFQKRTTPEMEPKQEDEKYSDFDKRYSNRLRKIKELKGQIEEESKRKHTLSTSVCFVSFADSKLVLHILKDRKILEEMPAWRICPAPHPRDIIWKHLHIPRWYIIVRMIFYNLLLAIFYVVITWIISHLNLLQTVKSVETVSEGKTDSEYYNEFSGVTETVNINDVSESSFWNAFMPPIVMATLNTFVHPTMINTVSRQIGFWTQSTYQKYLLFGHVVYLIISTILIPVLASMIAFWKLFDGAFDALSIDLGKVLVSTSWRFSTIYMLNAMFLGSSNQLLQLSQIALRGLGIYFFKYDLGMTNFDFGYWYAFHLSILTLVMLFSVFIPYLPILGTLYFAIRYCVDRHNIAYDVIQLPLDSTGKISASAVKSMLLCISLTQFAMSGVFLNCQHVLPPLCITLLYIASVATWLLLYASNSDTMVEATESLHKFRLKPLNKLMMDTIKICYMHPCDSKDLIERKPMS